MKKVEIFGYELDSKLVDCDRHGTQTDYGWGCQSCLIDTQKEIEAEAEIAQKKVMLAKMRQRRIEQNLETAMIPPRFASASFQNFEAKTAEHKRVCDIARAYALGFFNDKNQGDSMIFYGGVGAGKTHLACAIANALIAKCGRNALFTNISKIDQMIKATWQNSSKKTSMQVYQELRDIDLLIIDEVGVSAGGKFEDNFLFNVINDRYEHFKPLILISNLDLEEIKKTLGSRIYSRLCEKSEALLFNFSDYRKLYTS